MSIRLHRVATVLVAAIALTSVGQAVLTVGVGASTTSTTVMKSAPTLVNGSWSRWRTTWIAFLATLRSIGQTYRSAVSSAEAAFKVELTTATTNGARDAARERFNTALETAIMNRVTATMTLGDPPTPPAGSPTTAAFVAVIRNSSIAFHSAIDNAQHAYAQSLATAVTAQQRTAAVLTLKTAIDNAVITRSSILEALGVPRNQPRH